ncbi:hypothetical protein PLICRDRAFT_37130 [Plicaturopsis crispa FD-325 SS-3]|nr:hypothetical protein PLICRDRAFT_37130 [Plicaturopsis crispa FD-325 SS-3]
MSPALVSLSILSPPKLVDQSLARRASMRTFVCLAFRSSAAHVAADRDSSQDSNTFHVIPRNGRGFGIPVGNAFVAVIRCCFRIRRLVGVRAPLSLARTNSNG